MEVIGLISDAHAFIYQERLVWGMVSAFHEMSMS